MKGIFYLIIPLIVSITTSSYSQTSLWSCSIIAEQAQFKGCKNLSAITNSNTANKILPSIAFGAGILTFKGDVGEGLFNNLTPGYNISVEQDLNKFTAIAVNGMYGKLLGNNKNNFQILDFESKIFQGDFNFLFHLNKPVTPYLSVGVGYLGFNPYGDFKNKNGSRYYYWSDGSIKNLPENELNKKSAIGLSRDYDYETKLKDSINNYKRNTPLIPIGVGLDAKLFDHFSIRAGITYYLTFSDWIDNNKQGNSTDSYLYANLSLYYRFKKNRSEGEENPAFEKIDANDSDNDGVKDFDDKCPGTPKGEIVNQFGCLVDSDEDGIPDINDKEKNSAQGAIVDADGVTLTDETIVKRYEQFNILASGKAQIVEERNESLDDSASFPKTESAKIQKEATPPNAKAKKINEGLNEMAGRSPQPAKGDVQQKINKTLIADKAPDSLNNVYGEKEKNITANEKLLIENKLADDELNTPKKTKSVFESKRSMPTDLIYFDKDKDNEISKDEIDMAVNSFFDGDKAITITKINKLITYFFEQ